MGEAGTPFAVPEPRECVDRYEIVAPLARGGMAAVYVARRRGYGGFEKLFAMKFVLPHLAAERKYCDMFLDEARIASQVHHPNVVQIFDVGEHRGMPFMVMELLRGQTLARVLERGRDGDAGRGLSKGQLLGVLAQAALGLEAAHEAQAPDGSSLGLVHRDVSPQNVHVGYDGRVCVLDFGIAAAAGKRVKTRTGELRGRFGYLSPEQVSHEYPVDRRSDVWAVGVVAWEALAGQRLFGDVEEASTLWKVMHQPIAPLDCAALGVPPAVGACIAACLARDPADRPPSAREVAEVFAAAADELEPGHARSLGATVSAAFAQERAEDLVRFSSERLADDVGASVRDEDPTPIDPRPAPDLTPAADTPSRRAVAGSRRRWLASSATALGLCAVVAAGLLALRSSPGAAGADVVRTAIAAPAASPTRETAPRVTAPAVPPAPAPAPAVADAPPPEPAPTAPADDPPRSAHGARRARHRGDRARTAAAAAARRGASSEPAAASGAHHRPATPLLRSPYAHRVP